MNRNPPPMPLTTDAKETLSKLGLSLAYELWFRAGESFVQSEVEFRQAGRATSLALPSAMAERHSANEKNHNDAGLAYLTRSLSEIETASASWDKALIERLNASTKSAEFLAALTRFRATVSDSLYGADVTPADAREIMQIWDESMPVGLQGFTAVINKLVDHGQRLHELRSKPNRGREPHSPLPWWKWVILAGIILVSIGALIACLWWSGCSWILQYASLVNPWALYLVQSGC